MRRAAIAVGFISLLAACVTNPITGRRQLKLFSEARMVKMGVQAYAEARTAKGAKICHDPRLTAPLIRVGRAIAAAANKPDYKWQFTLFDDMKTVNAWCMPGGKIAFYTGIYPVLKDEAGMAIVMGHEVMHAILGHGNERMSQAVVAEAGLAVADVSLNDNRYHDLILKGLGVGVKVGALLPYSREHEREADHYGLFLAARAGYDPSEAVVLWQRMKKAGGSRPPEFLSTHPAPESRIAAMKRLLPKAMVLYRAAPVKHANRPLPMP